MVGAGALGRLGVGEEVVAADRLVAAVEDVAAPFAREHAFGRSALVAGIGVDRPGALGRPANDLDAAGLRIVDQTAVAPERFVARVAHRHDDARQAGRQIRMEIVDRRASRHGPHALPLSSPRGRRRQILGARRRRTRGRAIATGFGEGLLVPQGAGARRGAAIASATPPRFALLTLVSNSAERVSAAFELRSCAAQPRAICFARRGRGSSSPGFTVPAIYRRTIVAAATRLARPVSASGRGRSQRRRLVWYGHSWATTYPPRASPRRFRSAKTASACWSKASRTMRSSCSTSTGGCSPGTPAPSASRATRPHEIIGQHFSRFYPPDALARGVPAHELKVARAEGSFEDEGWRRAQGRLAASGPTSSSPPFATRRASSSASPRSRAT